MTTRAGERVRLFIAEHLLAPFILAWVRTFRVTLLMDDEAFTEAKPRLFAFFHGQQMALLAGPRPLGTTILVSLSRDGEIQTAIMQRLGLSVIRGSSSRGGARGLLSLVRALGSGGSAALAVDGPRGPAHVAKPGAVLAAVRSGAELVPVATAASRAFVLGRAWDRFEIPWPFSRVAIVVGKPVQGSDSAALGWCLEALRRRAVEEVSVG